ncbi:MAG: ATP-binding protein, partial [Candidatus Dormibacteraeota bacterium]|nr:ATP-binding protein [Candidatus Dormibacteraeota bacterium]
MIGAVTVARDRLELDTGEVTVVLRSGDLDLDALDPARRASALSAFAGLCHSIDSPLQLVVRIRPLATVEAPGDDELGAAMARQRMARAAGLEAHSREILVAVRGVDGDQAELSAERAASALRAVGAGAVRLAGEELGSAVSCLGGEWSESARSARFGGSLVAGLALRRLPGHPVGAGWLRPLLMVRACCDLAIHLQPAPLGAALTSLGRKLRDFAAHRMLEAERGRVGDVQVDIGLDAAHALRGRLARGSGQPLQLSVVALGIAGDEAGLRVVTERLRSAFSAALIAAEPLHFRHAAARLATLPLGVDPVRAGKLVDSAAAASCVPWLAAGCADPGGYRMGEHRVSHEPVLLDPFDTARHHNANLAVLAASGHGKSFALGTLVLEAVQRGVQCIVVDPEQEYHRLATALAGTHVTVAAGSDCGLSVFEGDDGDDESRVTAVGEFVATVCARLDDVERALVDRAARAVLTQARAAGEQPHLAACLPLLGDTAPRVAAVIDRYCSGALARLFDGTQSLTLDPRLHVFSLRDVPAEHMPAVSLLIARSLWRLVRHEPRRRHIVFDEAGALCEHAALRSLLVQLARRCRKHGASLVVATQNAQDLLVTHEGSVVATNSATVLLGGHRAAEAARMEAAFGLTAAQRRFVETAARGEFLLLAGDRRLEMRIDVP